MNKLRRFAGRVKRAVIRRIRPAPSDDSAALTREPPDPRFADLRTFIDNGQYDHFDELAGALALEDFNRTRQIRLTSLRAERHFAQCSHAAVSEAADALLALDSPLGYLWHARRHAICGERVEAASHLNSALYRTPTHEESIYLLASIASWSGRKEDAWSVLERLTLSSKRARTYHALANLVEDPIDLNRLLRLWHEAVTTKTISRNDRAINEYLALGALRTRNFQMARDVWRRTFAAVAKAGMPSAADTAPAQGSSRYNSARAEAALRDLQAVLAGSGIEMFLISGTLLGCIREGRLLGHDKDVDVGVWEHAGHDGLVQLLAGCGRFTLMASRSTDIIRVRHANGVACDVFIHHRDPDDFWHAGVKMKWHNSPFQLERREFLGDSFLIPADADRYLTENYGDWRTPKISFDSSFDTPNGEVINNDEMIIHCYKTLTQKILGGDADGAQFYANKLRDLGEPMAQLPAQTAAN